MVNAPRVHSSRSKKPAVCAEAVNALICLHQWRTSSAGERVAGGAERCLREIEHHEAAEQSYMEEGVQILELARNAQSLFERQQPREKRRLLIFILSNCSSEDGRVLARLRQPFDLLAKSNAIPAGGGEDAQ
jgi:hypothetical protein